MQHILLLAGRKTAAADGRQTDSERRIIFARTTVGWDGNLSYAVVNKCANSRYRRLIMGSIRRGRRKVECDCKTPTRMDHQ